MQGKPRRKIVKTLKYGFTGLFLFVAACCTGRPSPAFIIEPWEVQINASCLNPEKDVNKEYPKYMARKIFLGEENRFTFDDLECSYTKYVDSRTGKTTIGSLACSLVNNLVVTVETAGTTQPTCVLGKTSISSTGKNKDLEVKYDLYIIPPCDFSSQWVEK
jgi:hypothetical protein